MTDGSTIGLAAAFAAGTASFLSPCVLPLVPGYVSYIAGQSLPGRADLDGGRGVVVSLTMAALFVLGFSTVFVALGASASAVGQWLLRYREEVNILGGMIVITFGLAMLGLLRRVSWFQRDLRLHPQLQGGRPVAAYILGLAFGFGWTPCIGPVLGAILTMTAVSGQGEGMTLLAVYSAGLGIPFLLAALFTGRLLGYVQVLRRISRPLHVLAGWVMVVMGLAMITGQLSAFSLRLLRVFPALSSIG